MPNDSSELLKLRTLRSRSLLMARVSKWTLLTLYFKLATKQELKFQDSAITKDSQWLAIAECA
jgi:hypothetical protein